MHLHESGRRLIVITVLVALLILTVLGLLVWPDSSKRSYLASGAFGLAALMLAILVVLGRL